MNITNHILNGVEVQRSPNMSGLMTPTGVIMHYTAGYTGASAIAALTNPTTKVSAHVVIDRDGTVTQLVPFNRIAWHAGPSILDGISGCNNFCIGIELVNIGWFKIGANGALTDSYGHTLSDSDKAKFDLTVVAPNARLGGGNYVWPKYTDAQIEALKQVFAAILATYKISHLAGHEEIDTRKWKTDPGVAFPMSIFKHMLHGGSTNAVPDRSDGAPRLTSKFLINTPKLNVRDIASPNGTVVTTLTGGSEVVVIKDLGAYSLIEYAPGHTGYVADQYLRKE